MNGILGRKVEMTQWFDPQGRLVPVTLIKAGPCVVTQVKTNEKDGYESIQIGLVERRSRRNVSKAIRGICEKADVAPLKIFGEFPLEAGQDTPVRGAQILCSIFAAGDVVNVVGWSKGRGFQGVVKRHGFRGGAGSHGSMFHRAPGSIGASEEPSRVLKGTRMGGQFGCERITVKNLEIVHVDAESGLIAVRGAVPGSRNGLVRIARGYMPSRRKEG